MFSDDGTLAYIAGAGDKIYVFDTETQDIVATYTVQGSSAAISSLAVSDGWLYVAEGSNYGSGGQLVRINVDESSPDFLSNQQTLNIPGRMRPTVSKAWPSMTADTSRSPRRPDASRLDSDRCPRRATST